MVVILSKGCVKKQMQVLYNKPNEKITVDSTPAKAGTTDLNLWTLTKEVLGPKLNHHHRCVSTSLPQIAAYLLSSGTT